MICEVCETAPVVFVIHFEDGITFHECTFCALDLYETAAVFSLTLTVTAYRPNFSQLTLL